MPRYEHFVARHGEIVVQSIIENLERFEGIHASRALSLEERWQTLMYRQDNNQRRRVA